ncbi:MAG: hypothetical protein ABJA86_06725 [Nocardioidaceae bacterium]
MPPIINIIISGQASTIKPKSRVVTGTPTAASQTISTAKASAYIGNC